jgi:NADH dehydrogenase
VKIFVTGAAGFVGREVVRQLLAAGYKVRALVRDPKRARKVLSETVELYQWDVTRPEGIRQGMTGCQAVVHLVGIIFETGGATFEEIHVQGTRHVLEAARDEGIRRFIHMSALGTRPDARSRYHQTKHRAENLVRESGLDWTIFRPSVIFGPNDRFVNRLARIMRNAPVVPLIGSGQARLQPIGVSDVAACMVLSVGNPVSIGKVYELGGPQTMTYDELYSVILEVLNLRKRIIHLPAGLIKPAVYILEQVLSRPPLTRDQMIMLEENNVCRSDLALSDFGLELKPFKEGIREYLQA